MGPSEPGAAPPHVRLPSLRSRRHRAAHPERPPPRVVSVPLVWLTDLVDIFQFAVATIAALPSVVLYRTRRRELIVQIDALGVGALPITHITGFIAGLLMGVQTRSSLQQFGVTTLFAQGLTLALVREVGPTFVALISGARAASGIASELATMSVTQQVDALRALRRGPIPWLAAPRTLACIIAFPALGVVGILAGLVGGMLVGLTLHQNFVFFFHQAASVLSLREIVPNLIAKPALFGLLIGIFASHHGLRAEGGTRAVGGSTVSSVVVVTVGILIADYVIGETFRHFWPPAPW